MTMLTSAYGFGFARPDDRQPARSENTSVDARMSVYPLGDNHPLASVLGAFDDEPLWDDWMAAIADYRQEVTARELEE